VRAGELQTKDVINIVDGRKLGTIGDLEIDLETGFVRALIIPPEGKFFGLFSKGDEVVIAWDQIVKIGSDVVLVDLRLANDRSYLSSSSAADFSGRYG
jgi:YlmC/YmxH family sporulation protein